MGKSKYRYLSLRFRILSRVTAITLLNTGQLTQLSKLMEDSESLLERSVIDLELLDHDNIDALNYHVIESLTSASECSIFQSSSRFPRRRVPCCINECSSTVKNKNYHLMNISFYLRKQEQKLDEPQVTVSFILLWLPRINYILHTLLKTVSSNTSNFRKKYIRINYKLKKH